MESIHNEIIIKVSIEGRSVWDCGEPQVLSSYSDKIKREEYDVASLEAVSKLVKQVQEELAYKTRVMKESLTFPLEKSEDDSSLGTPESEPVRPPE